MKIEKAEISDSEEILGLQKLAYASEARLYHDRNIPPMTETLKDIQSEFERQVFLKAVDDKKTVGTVRAYVHDGTCYIGRLAVHPDFQNQGIGKMLMSEIEHSFNKKCTRFELFTGHKSEKNISLYQKLGYKIFKDEKVSDQVSLFYLEKYCKLDLTK